MSKPDQQPSSTSPRLSVSVQTEDFSLQDEHAKLVAGDRGIGAVVAFIGMVRDLNLADDVIALELEHYPGMTEKKLRDIAEQAAKRWSLQAARIVHRVGKMYPGDQIVMVLTASAHRQDAYTANEFMMDFLKTEAPFWKKEWTAEGHRWVEARSSDDAAVARWGLQ